MRIKRCLAFLLAFTLLFSEATVAHAEDVSGNDELNTEISTEVFADISESEVTEPEIEVYDDDISSGEEKGDEKPSIIYSDKKGDIIFSLDSNGLLLIEGTGNYRYDYIPEPKRSLIKKAVVKTTGATTAYNMFNDYGEMKEVDLSDFDTSMVTNMSGMFRKCTNLLCPDVSGLDTSNVTNMSSMFEQCRAATKIDVSNFDTSKVEDMFNMFFWCDSLPYLDVSGFKTAKVKDMTQMFAGCSSLSSLNVSKFDTSLVELMGGMFQECSGLTSLNVSNFDTSNVDDMGAMFDKCSGLTTIDVSNFDTSKVTYMSCMFDECNSLINLDVSKFDTSKVTDMSYMFEGCSTLTSLNVSNFNTSNVTNMCSMFNNCSGLSSLNISKFDISKVTNMSSMFRNCSALQSLDLSGFVNSESISGSITMLSGCEGLKKLILPHLTYKKGHTFFFATDSTPKRLEELELTLDDPDSIWSTAKIKKFESVTRLVLKGKLGKEQSDASTKKTVKFGMSFPKVKYLDLSGVKMISEKLNLADCEDLYEIKTPVNVSDTVMLPDTFVDKNGKKYTYLPKGNDSKKSITLKRAVKKIEYTITFNSNTSSITDYYNGTKTPAVSGKMSKLKVATDSNKAITANAFKIKGYEFAGWNTMADGSGDSYVNKEKISNISASGNLTLYAQWRKAVYKITYNGLTEDEVSSNNLKTSYCVDSDPVTFNDFTASFSREGYDFKGLYTTKKYEKKFKSINTGSTGNKTVFVKLVPHKYKLSFYRNEGSIRDFKGTKLKSSGKMKTQTVTFGKSTAITKNGFKVTGYNFVVWNTEPDGSGIDYLNRESVLNLSPDNGAVIKLYAIWEKAEYTITYPGLTEEEVRTFGLPTAYHVDDETINFAPFKAEIVRTGYTFKNFYSDKKYKKVLKSIKTGSTGNKKVYVKMQANKYKLVFKRNESSIEGKTKCSGKMSAQTVTYGKTAKITANAFKINGYIFTGWNTEPDGSGKSYANKETISNLTPNNGESIVLYAQWQKK